MVFVVVPNIIWELYNLDYIAVPPSFTFYAMLLYVLGSASTIVSYPLFNSEFRNALIKLFRREQVTKVNPIAAGGTTL